MVFLSPLQGWAGFFWWKTQPMRAWAGLYSLAPLGRAEEREVSISFRPVGAGGGTGGFDIFSPGWGGEIFVKLVVSWKYR